MVGPLAGQLTDQLVGQLVGQLVDPLVCPLFGLSVFHYWGVCVSGGDGAMDFEF